MSWGNLHRSFQMDEPPTRPPLELPPTDHCPEVPDGLTGIANSCVIVWAAVGAFAVADWPCTKGTVPPWAWKLGTVCICASSSVFPPESKSGRPGMTFGLPER